MNYYLKAIHWNRLVLIIYSCMMMKSCLFVTSDRYVTLYKRAFKVEMFALCNIQAG